MQSFWPFVEQTDPAAVRAQIDGCTARDVERALSREAIAPEDFPALFSPAAAPFLEVMAQRCKAITERRFGRVILLYTPLYLTNECVNKCTYCGFSHDLEIPRITLTPAQAQANARLLHDEGFRHLLLVAGESRRHLDIPYLIEVVKGMRPLFDSISIEIQSLRLDEYRQLVAAGVDGMTLYQETYDAARYKEVHLTGPKRVMHRRVEAMESAGIAGVRSLGIGALLGLNPWRFEAVMLAHHGRYLTRRFWQTRIAVSFPRIREAAGDYQPDFPVSDREMAQMIFAMRLILPDCELVLSTREPAWLRDNFIGLGITRMSAGSKTNPGGYTNPEDHGGEQFEIEDARSPEEFARVIAARGYEPVWKDFDREFIPGETETA